MKILLCLAFSSIVFISCSNESLSPPDEQSLPITLTLDNFHPASTTQNYVLWFRYGSQNFQPALRFRIAPGGTLTTLDGATALHYLTEGKDLHTIFSCLISLEQSDTASSPSSRICAGAMGGSSLLGECVLTCNDSNALGHGFSIGGVATIFDPRKTSDKDSLNSIWFVDTTDRALMHAGLENLPPDQSVPHWKYEGWILDSVSFPTHQFSTGTFDSASGKDSDVNDPIDFPGGFSPNATAKAFPIVNGNFQIVVSLEPLPDNDPNHISPVVLARGKIPKNSVRGAKIEITSLTFPNAKVTVKR